MTDIHFAYPWMLGALLVIPLVMLWRPRFGRTLVLLLPYAVAWSPRKNSTRSWWITCFYVAIALLVIAVARPQRDDQRQDVVSRGYDLILAVDLSTSMLAEDYSGPKGAINRLDAIRPVLQAFITKRPDDRIGVVVFAGRAYTMTPLTTDHGWLEKQVADLRIGMIEDGTAIGDGLGIALTNLEKSRGDQDAVGAFVILLTDGANTSGSLTPPQATAIARHRHVPVYTVGAGRNGMVPFPIFDDAGRRIGTRQRPSSLDVEALQTMSKATDGRFFEAGDARTVAAAFASIDAARKAEFHVKVRTNVVELFVWPALLALIFLLIALPGLRRTYARPARQATA